ncbi:hypothetical protein D3C71_1313190 [compost metagenome]
MRQVSARLQVQSQDLVAGHQQRQIDRLVGLAARMGLHIDVRGAEKQLRPRNRDRLRNVYVGAAAVVAAARITFGVLVRKDRTLRIEHGAAGEILRRDEFDGMHLAMSFGVNGRPDVAVGLGQGKGADDGQRPAGLCGMRHDGCVGSKNLGLKRDSRGAVAYRFVPHI